MDSTSIQSQHGRSHTAPSRERRTRVGILATLILLVAGAAAVTATRPVAAAAPTLSPTPVPVCCGDPLPDLIITGFGSCPGVCVVVKNRSTAFRAGTFSVKFDTPGKAAQYIRVAGLGAGASITVQFTPPGCNTGGQTGRVRVDALNQVTESSETNNTADWSRVC